MFLDSSYLAIFFKNLFVLLIPTGSHGLLLDYFILALTFCDLFRPTWPGLLLIGLIMH